MNHEHALQRAIRYVGSQATLAARLSVKKRRINSWLNRDKKIPFHYAIAIERLTEGTVILLQFDRHSEENQRI